MKIWFLWDRERDGPESESYECRRFLEVGQARGYDVRIYDPVQFKIMCGGGAKGTIFIDGKVEEKPDAIMTRLIATQTYLSLAILRHMLRNGVAVINRAASIDKSFDKLRCMQILSEHNIPVPKTMFSKCPVDADLIEQQIGFPVVVKTLNGAQGGGVYLSENKDNLRDITGLMVHQGIDKSPVLFQEFIEFSRGRDIRAFVVGKKVLACMERKATDGSFKSNLTRGGAGTPVPVTPEIERIAVETAEALELEIAGIDLLYTKDGYKVCEANNAPGFKGLETYCGISVPEKIYDYIEQRVKKNKQAQKGNVIQGFFGKWLGRHAA